MMKGRKLLLLGLLIAFVFSGFLFAEGQQESAAAPAQSAADVVDAAVNSYFAEMPGHIYKIGQQDFIDKVAAGDEMTVLDIRRPDDYAKGHIVGAVNLPWPTAALYEKLADIPTDGEVFIYCYSGQTAGQAVMLLNFAGIPARSVNLGWNFGISKVDGYEAVTETAANTLAPLGNEIDPALFDAYKGYYEAIAEAAGTPFASNIVSEENAKAILDSGDDSAVFVSIRQADAYAAGHIETATNMPWGKGMQDMFASLPADKKIIIYCYSGQTAGQTVAGLRLLGYDAVSLKGGMGVGPNAPLGWANKGYPVVQ